MKPTVRLDTDARGVACLTLTRPEVKNAFDARFIAELADALGKIDLAARCVVLRADGDVFCAGADLTWMRAVATQSVEENLADARRLAAMYAQLDELPMPLIARVQGAAIGGGAGLVAVADIAVASDDAVFAFSEVRLGIVPAVVSPYVVRKIGPAHATAAFVTGMRFDARRALEIGLVESVAPAAHLDAKVERYVGAVLAGGPRAVNTAKRLVREVVGREPRDVRELTTERIAQLRAGDEAQEGMRAFLERRDPSWPA